MSDQNNFDCFLKHGVHCLLCYEAIASVTCSAGSAVYSNA